jgi:hypothetical protein
LRFDDGLSFAAGDAIGFDSCFSLVELFLLNEMEVTIRPLHICFLYFGLKLHMHSVCRGRRRAQKMPALACTLCALMPFSR